MITRSDLVAEYLLHERSRLENDVKQLQDAVRYRNIDTVDCLELIIAKVRLSCLLEISANIRALLGARKKK